MPKFLEDQLRRAGRKKGFTGEKLEHYVYGGMNNLGAMHGSKETAKGAAMEAKHERDKTMKSPHRIEEIRIEVHRDKQKNVTGHTLHQRTLPTPAKKGKDGMTTGAFYEDTRESYPFDAKGNSSSHGHMLDHLKTHLGLGGKSMPAAEKANAEQMEGED